MDNDLQEKIDAVEAEGAFAFRIGSMLRENPYPADHAYHEHWEKGFWNALGQIVEEHSQSIVSVLRLQRQLETSAKNIDYLRSRLSNYEDPDIGTYDHKDRMILDMEREW
jgi:hypothetical protein